MFEEIPEELLHSLLHACIKACSDNDKVKTNAARVLGNLLQILPEELLKKVDLKKTAETAINVLVNNATAQSNVKVNNPDKLIFSCATIIHCFLLGSMEFLLCLGQFTEELFFIRKQLFPEGDFDLIQRKLMCIYCCDLRRSCYLTV